MPSPRLTVQSTGVLLALGGLAILLGVWPDIGALLLAAFLVPTAFVMHPFWREENPEAEQPHFLKDLALGGAAIVMFGVFASGAATGLMLTGPLLDLG